MTKLTPGERMTLLACSFPSINERWPGVLPWDACKLAGAYGTSSSGERQAIAFLLTVWNSTQELVPPFRAIDAMSTWDLGHRRAFAAWVASPFTC